MREVYTLQDLHSRAALDAGADAPARLAVVGWPVGHSRSPQMHQPALDAQGLAMRYIRLAVEPGGIPAAFARLRELEFIGCNVTVPHKLAAMANCTWVDPAAQSLGAVNTVHFADGETRGYNTDGPGFARAIEETFGAPLASLRVAIAGAGGGAGQAIATQAAASGVPRLVLINRSSDKLTPIVERLLALHANLSLDALALDDPSVPAACRDCDLIVNTSSLGLQPGDPPVLSAACLTPRQWVYDTIYQPPLTPLLALAQATGCRTANGLSMLLHQGALAFQHWFPHAAPLEIMRQAIGAPGRR